MRNLKRTHRRRMVIAAAVLLGLTPTALVHPAQAKSNPGACQSDDDWDNGHTARGWCYGGREKDARREMRLYVFCEGDPREHVAPFDKTMYIRMGYRLMPVPAAEYKCGSAKVKSHRVGARYA